MVDYNVGLNLREEFRDAPTIEGVPVSIGGMVVRTRKGDIVKPMFCTSWEEFVRKCGSYYGGYVGPKHVRGFFVNEGKGLWISRVLKPQVYAYLITGLVPSNNALLWTALHSGAQGNSIRIKLTDPGSGPLPLLVTVTQTSSGWDIEVRLETNAVPAIISTATQVIAAINAHLTARKVVSIANSGGSTGAGVMTALAYTPLATGSGPAVGDTWLADSDEGSYSAKVSAKNPGAWANGVKVTTAKVSTTLATSIGAGATTSAVLTSVRDLEVGDVAVFDDGAALTYVIITSITAATKTITFKSKVFPTYAATTTIVSTSTVHALSSTIKTALVNGATQIELANATGVRVGSLIHIGDGTNEAIVLVTNISGAVIYFAAVTGLGASIAANTPATSFEFDIYVEDDTGEFEDITQLSMEPTNSLNYINNRLSGSANQSDFIEVLDLNPGNTPSYLNIPYPITDQPLTQGMDGETPGDSDYIGVSTPGSETGLYRFKGKKEISMIAIPGQTSQAVIQAGIDWCDFYLHAMFIASVPQAVDTVEEAIDFRDHTLTSSSMRAALYFPWLTIRDPETQSASLLDVSPEGWVMGVWARTRVARGYHKAPANEVIKGIAGLVTDNMVVDWDEASLLLNPRGVNIIRDVPGWGIRVYGARTLLKTALPQQFIHVVATTIYNEQSILAQANWMPFEPNNADLATDSLKMIERFFYQQWKDGVFVPEDNPDAAYYIYNGDGINPEARKQAGEFKTKFGFQVVGTAEKVIFIVTNMNGQNSIEE